jgi:membrane fusion protein (multidrug efflux system)
VQELQGQFTVVLVDAENKAQSRKVKTGPRVDNLWILEEGVKPGDKVIVEGAQKVRDGMLVKAEPAPPEPASPPPQAGPVPAAASIGAAASKAESSSR